MKNHSLRRRLALEIGTLVLLLAASATVYADPPSLALCTSSNTTPMSVQVARLKGAGPVDRWFTRGDFNYTAGTVFDPLGEPKVWIAFEVVGSSAPPIFMDTTVPGHPFTESTPLVLWKYVYKPSPGEAAGFYRGTFRNLPLLNLPAGQHEPTNKVRFLLRGVRQQVGQPFVVPSGAFSIRQTILIDNQLDDPPAPVLCAVADMCCHSSSPGPRLKCKSQLTACQ